MLGGLIDLSSFKIPVTRFTREEPEKSLKVVGAGLGRTGTASLHCALVRLGFGPCFHMVTLFSQPELSDDFLRAYRGEKVDFKKMMAGFQSTLDAPPNNFLPELRDAFPDAKFVLSVRDSGEAWSKSIKDTVGEAGTWRYAVATFPFSAMRKQATIARYMYGIWERLYGAPMEPETHDKHNEYVKSIIPADRLLEYNVKEGWEPLCKFLEVPVPDEPFPRVNDSKSIRSTLNLVLIMGFTTWAAALGAIGALGMWVHKTGFLRMAGEL